MGTFASPLRVENGAAGRPVQGARLGSPVKLLHALLLATASLVFAWPIALATGLFAGAAAAVVGSLLGERLALKRYRLYAILLFAVGLSALGKLLTSLLLDARWISEALSPSLVLHLAEAVRWSSVGASGAIVLRATALRYRAALAIEGSIVVLAVATTVASHRDGMIARPLEVSDWFWTQGIDPVLAFLAIGLSGALLLAVVLAYGRSAKRTVLQLVFVFLLGILLAVRIHGADVEQPKRNPSGGQLESNKDDPRKGGGEKRNGEKSERDGSPFEEDLPRGGEGGQNRPAAIVIFHKDVEPSAGIFYFRHVAFSQYNGVRLVESTRPGIDLDAVRTFPTAKQVVPGTSPDGVGRTLVATDVALLTDHKRMFALTDATEVSPMPNPEPARFRRAYRVVSSVITESYQDLLGGDAGDPGWSDEVWEHYTALPKDERYHRLAAELKGTLRSEYESDPMAMAMTVKRYLEKSATYSFKKSYEGEADPTAAFLFSEEKIGYCVHLAHATTFLLRAMGVPARVSAGYAVPAANLGGGSALLIKSGDAHAWAEIYLRGTGWVPIEVTPEKVDVKPAMFGEKDLQQLLGEMARKEGRADGAPYKGPTLMDAIRAFSKMLPWVALALLLSAYVLKVWRLIAPFVAGTKQMPRVAYRAALDRLSAIGFLRSPGEPRERFARRVETITPSFGPLTSAHVGVALGSREAMDSLFSEGAALLPKLSSRVGRELRHRVPWWRWVLGALNPVSWLFSR